MVEETPGPTDLEPQALSSDTPATVSDPSVGQPTGSDSSIASWAGDTVTGMIGRSEAKANEAYEAYEGPLTAGTDELQDKAFAGIAGLSLPTNDMGVGGYKGQDFTGGNVQKYMNPYLQASLKPQQDEARRQAAITASQNSNRFAGAYGGSAQALFDAESNRNLEQNLAAITGQGYADAYDRGLAQYNTREDRRSVNQDKINTYGKTGLELQAALGGLRRGIESEGIAADRAQWGEEKDYDYKQLQFLQSMLNGLPITAQNYSYSAPSKLSELLGGVGGIQAIWDMLYPDDVGGGPGQKAADNEGEAPEGEAPAGETQEETPEETPNGSATGGLIGLAGGGQIKSAYGRPVGFAPGGPIIDDPMGAPNTGTSPMGAPNTGTPPMGAPNTGMGADMSANPFAPESPVGAGPDMSTNPFAPQSPVGTNTGMGEVDESINPFAPPSPVQPSTGPLTDWAGQPVTGMAGGAPGAGAAADLSAMNTGMGTDLTATTNTGMAGGAPLSQWQQQSLQAQEEQVPLSQAWNTPGGMQNLYNLISQLQPPQQGQGGMEQYYGGIVDILKNFLGGSSGTENAPSQLGTNLMGELTPDPAAEARARANAEAIRAAEEAERERQNQDLLDAIGGQEDIITNGLSQQPGPSGSQYEDLISKYEEAGMSREEAMRTAMDQLTSMGQPINTNVPGLNPNQNGQDIAAAIAAAGGDIAAGLNPNQNEQDIAAAIAAAEGDIVAGLGTEPPAGGEYTQDEAMDRFNTLMAGYEASGMSRDEALNTARQEIMADPAYADIIRQSQGGLGPAKIPTGTQANNEEMNARYGTLIEEYEAAGMSREEAMISAMNSLREIPEYAAEIERQMNQDIVAGPAREPAPALAMQELQGLLTNIPAETTFEEINNRLDAVVAEYENAGMSRQEAIAEVRTNPAYEEAMRRLQEEIAPQPAEVPTGTEAINQEVNARLTTLISQYENSGMSRQEATNAAVESLSTNPAYEEAIRDLQANLGDGPAELDMDEQRQRDLLAELAKATANGAQPPVAGTQMIEETDLMEDEVGYLRDQIAGIEDTITEPVVQNIDTSIPQPDGTLSPDGNTVWLDGQQWNAWVTVGEGGQQCRYDDQACINAAHAANAARRA